MWRFERFRGVSAVGNPASGTWLVLMQACLLASLLLGALLLAGIHSFLTTGILLLFVLLFHSGRKVRVDRVQNRSSEEKGRQQDCSECPGG